MYVLVAIKQTQLQPLAHSLTLTIIIIIIMKKKPFRPEAKAGLSRRSVQYIISADTCPSALHGHHVWTYT